jgi:chromosome segregation ATPase
MLQKIILKEPDELRRQQEKQLANLQKQAEEATKYKLITEEIKKNRGWALLFKIN